LYATTSPVVANSPVLYRAEFIRPTVFIYLNSVKLSPGGLRWAKPGAALSQVVDW
jgi:hypothetical protein